MNKDVVSIYEALGKKRVQYNQLFDYYDGNQPLVFSTQKLNEVFKSDVHFTLNICSVTIDAVKERISLTGCNCKDKNAQERLSDFLTEQCILSEADELHEAALITGESFLVIWPTDDGVDVFYNDPRNIHAIYDPSNPKQMRTVGKMWQEEDGVHKMILYYSDHLEYYRTSSATDKGAMPTEATAFIPDSSMADVSIEGDTVVWPTHDLGRIPVFHFRTQLRKPKSDLANVLPIQDAQNKLFSDMMVSADYGAYKQRWIISNSDTSALKNSPNSIWELPAGDTTTQATSVGEFSATDLKNYLDSIDSLIGYVSTITNTPKHYFQPTGDAPSGEALIAMEAPLNKKVQDRIDKFSPVWSEAMAFALGLLGISIPSSDISMVFKKPETVQPKTEVETMVSELKLYPLDIVLKRHNYSQSEIDEILARVQEEEAKKHDSIADVYAKALKKFDSGE